MIQLFLQLKMKGQVFPNDILRVFLVEELIKL